MLLAAWNLWDRETESDEERTSFNLDIIFPLCRDKISDSIGNGLKCAKSRIIEVAETINCNVACKLPGNYLMITINRMFDCFVFSRL